MAYNTGNSLGSTDPRDLSDNSENFDRFANGQDPAYSDRLGNQRKSFAGMESEFASFIASGGYVGTGTNGAVENYAAGITITGYNQIVRDSFGEFWRLSGPIALPYTTTGAGLPEGGAFVAVGDAVLRQELAGTVASGQGANLVNGATIYVGSVAELEALSLSEGVNVRLTDETRYGEGTIKAGTAPSDPEKGVYIPIANGNYWERTDKSQPNPRWFGGKVDGTLSDAALQACVSMFPGQRIYLNDGEHNYSVYPVGIDGVRFEGSSRITWTNVELPIFNGVFTGGRETAIVSGVLRFYQSGPSGAGWYMLKDAGQNHDPILLGPVATNDTSLNIELNISDFGLDETLWTPSGFSVTPDEELAGEITVGASVGYNILIYGKITAPYHSYIHYNGASFVGDTGTYTFQWLNDGQPTARLRVYKSSSAFRKINFTPTRHANDFPMLTPKTSAGASVATMPTWETTGIEGGVRYYDIAFYDMLDGSRLTTQSTRMAFMLQDPARVNQDIRFNSWPDQYGNLWIIGTFVRKSASL